MASRTWARQTALIGSLVLVFSPGCVSKGKHRAEIEETRLTMQERLELEVEMRQEQIRERDRRIAELERQRELDDRRIVKLEEDLAGLRRQLTGVINDRSQLRASAEEMQAMLDDLAARRRQAERRLAQYQDLLARFQAMIDSGTLRVKIADGRMVVELSTDVLFPSGSAALSQSGLKAIDEVAKILMTIDERRFQIEGHTDNVPIHNERFNSNWELSTTRALNVVHRMIAAGMQGDRISAAGFGEHRPTAPNDTAEGRRQNRRIEIVLVPDLSGLPGYEELEAAVSGR